jgi:hypothetical protein
VGKASKKKADRRSGIGPTRAETESGAEQEQVKRRLTAALRRPDELGATLRQLAGQAAAEQTTLPGSVTEQWGDETPVLGEP